MKEESLRETYKHVCNGYLHSFCFSYKLDYSDSSWVADEQGTVACIGDYYVGFDDIRYCVDNDVPFETWIQHYDYLLDAEYLGLPLINLPSWCKGAPRASKEQIAHLKELREDLFNQTAELAKSINGNHPNVSKTSDF